jgi:hypothetical protein
VVYRTGGCCGIFTAQEGSAAGGAAHLPNSRVVRSAGQEGGAGGGAVLVRWWCGIRLPHTKVVRYSSTAQQGGAGAGAAFSDTAHEGGVALVRRQPTAQPVVRHVVREVVRFIYRTGGWCGRMCGRMCGATLRK